MSNDSIAGEHFSLFDRVYNKTLSLKVRTPTRRFFNEAIDPLQVRIRFCHPKNMYSAARCRSSADSEEMKKDGERERGSFQTWKNVKRDCSGEAGE